MLTQFLVRLMIQLDRELKYQLPQIRQDQTLTILFQKNEQELLYLLQEQELQLEEVHLTFLFLLQCNQLLDHTAMLIEKIHQMQFKLFIPLN